jgi:hypothetical protein
MFYKRLFVLMPLYSSLLGCHYIRELTMPDEKNLLSGAGSIIVKSPKNEAKAFELIDIDKLLQEYQLNDPSVIASKHAADTASIQNYKYRRNDLQDRLIAASNQRCGTYIRTLISSKAETQMTWGGVATLLSGAASVVTPASAARALAAGSTVSSGYLSMYNEAYFNNVSLNVISTGISKQREGILELISVQRMKPLSDYPVNRAIADALVYHSACNVITGLEAASTALNKNQINVAPKLE